MKFVTKWSSFITLFAAILVLSSCGGDDPEKSEEEVQLEKLKGTWTMASVQNDGVDRSDEYPGMKITLSGTYVSGGTYDLTSSATDWPSLSPWKASDKWKFNSANVSSIIVRVTDNLDMNYTLGNSDKQLTITFNYSGPGFNNSRTSSVSGSWTFTFTK
ncbi:hypothetical protein WBG78_05745 [Chryseolinea sp. T2]|uniref:hypothetical protein n=1 Tax=Chryseolinea sp. T2 TaxID=3129255 RepID=UPI0030774CEF